MSARLKFPVNNSDHIRGNKNALLELVEYGDFECGNCGQAYPIIKEILREMDDDLKFVFRNFPLTRVHSHSLNAAIACEAAGLQNKFWEMHDIIFENQEQLESEDLLFYAEKIKLNVPQFTNDFKKNTLLSKVEADFESGMRSGVNSTPSFFINGIKYEGNWEEELIDYLKSQLLNV
jgi:protein-disulfide isomerase